MSRQNSSGPKTVTGKRMSSRNALKSGFFATELQLSGADKTELEGLRRVLVAELVPMTLLQSIALEKVVCCTWRLKLATRHEGQQLSAKNDTQKEDESPSDQLAGPAPVLGWYAASRQELNGAIRFLRIVTEDFRNNGKIRDEWKQDMQRAFGPEFYALLADWTPMSYDAILAYDHMVAMETDYGLTLPKDEDVKNHEKRVILDPMQRLQMVGKLLDLTLTHLSDLHRRDCQQATESTAQNASKADFAPRYFTTAARDLQRAVEWLQHLKKEQREN
jgi:hypothetical protein